MLPSWQKLYGNSPNPTEDEGKLVMEESELLMSNLGKEPLRKTNVLLDHNTIKLLGILQESLVSQTPHTHTHTPTHQQCLYCVHHLMYTTRMREESVSVCQVTTEPCL